MVLRSKPEKVEERERTRHALMQATLSLAAKHGFAGLGLREVARGAGIAPTSFYRHFADMEELGLALVTEQVRPLVLRWTERAASPGNDARQAAATLVELALDSVQEERALVRFMLAERVGAVPSCRRALRVLLSELTQTVHAQLASRASAAKRARDEQELHAVSEAAVTLMLQGCDDALELPEGDPAAASKLQARLEAQLQRVLSPAGS